MICSLCAYWFKKGLEDLPKNMNSMFDERYPFYDGDRNSLYFSSEGLAGLEDMITINTR